MKTRVPWRRSVSTKVSNAANCASVRYRRQVCSLTRGPGCGRSSGGPPAVSAERGGAELCDPGAPARSGDRVAVAAYPGSGSAFDRAMVRFAHRYADLNDRDHRSLLDAVRDGRIEATTGV